MNGYVIRTPWFQHKETVQVRADMPPMEATIPTQALIYCRLVDPDGIPVAREPVAIRLVDGGVPGRRSWHGLSDAGGQARATVTAGRWRVAVKRSGGWGNPPVIAASEEVEVEAGGETTVVLVIDREE